MPTLNLNKKDKKEYETFIKGISQQFPIFVPDKKTPSLVEEQECKQIDIKIDECFQISLDEGYVYQKMIKAKIDECFQNPDRSQCFQNPYPSQCFQNPDPRPAVHRTYLLEEFVNKPIDWVFQVSLTHEGLTLDILIQNYNLYLVGYKGKVEIQKKDKMEGKKFETETVERWILLQGNHLNRVKSVILSQNEILIEPIEAELDTSYLSLFSKSESGFTEEVRVEQSKGLYEKLKNKLEKTKEEVVKRENYAMKKLEEQEVGEGKKKNLLDWLLKFVAALEANGELEKDGTRVKSLRNYLAVEIEKPKKRSRAHKHAKNYLTEMKQKWEEEEKGQEQEIDRFRKQIKSVDNLLGWLEKINIAGNAAEMVDKDSKSKNLRMYLASSLKTLQKESITAEKLITKLEKEYSRMKKKNLGGTSEHTSVPDESWPISWVKKFEKAVEILKELDGERNFKSQVPNELEKKSDKEVQEELKTELDAVKKLVKKLVKRFSVEKDFTQGMEEQDVDRNAFDEQRIKEETSSWKAVLKKQYSQVLIKDWLEFCQDLKWKADHLKDAMQVLHTDAYSNIVRNKTKKLELNREALINAVKHCRNI